MSRPALVVFLAMLVLAALCACDRAEPAVSSPSPPRPATPRIVALSPAIAVTLRDLGLGDTLVGRHGFDAWSDPALPVCGDQTGLDYETLLSVNPTDVLVQLGAQPAPARLSALAAERGWTVRSFDPLTLEQVRAMAAELHCLYGGDGELLARLDAAWSRRPEIDASAIGPVALIDADSSGGLAGLAFLGPGSFHHDLLVRLGGSTAITEGSPFMILDAEDVVRLAPRAVIAFAPGADRAAAEAALTQRLERTPAAQNVRIAVITDPTGLLPGSNLARTADEMAAALRSWSAPGPE